MSDDSPLFVSSLELLAHATEIFAQKNPKKYKFVILHLANSIELILKDFVIDLGFSIYNNSKTIGIWDCFKKMEEQNIKIPERPIIELLVDDRNTIQHRFGFPDERTVLYYLNKVVVFFQRLLDEHYSLQLAETLEPYLSSQYLELLGLAKYKSGNLNEDGHLNELIKLSPEFAILTAFRDVEYQFMEIIGSENPRLTFNIQKLHLETFFINLEQKGFLQENSYQKYNELRALRNKIAHQSELEVADNDLLEKIEFSKQLISTLKKVKSQYKFMPDTNEILPIENNET